MGNGCAVDEGRRVGGVVGREGDVRGWVPVFCCELECEGEGQEGVYWGDGGAGVGDRESAGLLGLVREGEGEGGCTGGQKSSWRSTTSRAGVKGVGSDMVVDGCGGGACGGCGTGGFVNHILTSLVFINTHSACVNPSKRVRGVLVKEVTVTVQCKSRSS